MLKFVEFKGGDTKSNQQTSSHLNCSVTINNSVEKIKDDDEETVTPKNNVRTRSTTFKDEDNEDNEYVKYLKPRVKVPIRHMTRSVPQNVERYVMVSKQPIITAEHIYDNIEIYKKLVEILTSTLTSNDKKLIANIIDTTDKIILSASELCELIALTLTTDEYEVKAADVIISYHDDIITSCCKVHISPFKHILSIKINNQDFKTFQNEAYNVLTDIFKISLNTVYIPFLSKK